MRIQYIKDNQIRLIEVGDKLHINVLPGKIRLFNTDFPHLIDEEMTHTDNPSDVVIIIYSKRVLEFLYCRDIKPSGSVCEKFKLKPNSSNDIYGHTLRTSIDDEDEPKNELNFGQITCKYKYISINEQ